jgi:hypothetical protein
MRRFLAVAVAIGFLIAGKGALAAQGYVYQGLVGDPSAGSVEAMAAMPNGDLAVTYYGTSTGYSVVVFDNKGNKIRTFPNLGSQYMAVDSKGRFIFLEGGKYIDVFNSAGKLIASKDIGIAGFLSYYTGPTIGVNDT